MSLYNIFKFVYFPCCVAVRLNLKVNAVLAGILISHIVSSTFQFEMEFRNNYPLRKILSSNVESSFITDKVLLIPQH